MSTTVTPSATHTTETRLADALQAIATGDDRPLAVVMEILTASGRAHLRTMGLDTDEADDALQLTFCELHRVAARFDPERGRALPFCFTILRRRAIDQVRRRRRGVDLEAIAERPAADVDHDARIDLGTAFRRLPADLQPTARLWLSGAPRSEMAWRTGSDARTLAARLRKTQRSLHRELRDA